MCRRLPLNLGDLLPSKDDYYLSPQYLDNPSAW